MTNDKTLLMLNRELLHAWVEDNYDKLFGFVFYMVKNKSFTEEITSEAIIRALSKAHTYNPEKGNIRNWVFSIAKNAVINSYRNKANRAFQIEDVSILVDEKQLTAEEYLIQKEAIINIMNCFSKLSRREQEIFSLHYGGGLKYQEISKIKDMQIGTIASILKRGRKKLSLCIEVEHE